MEVFRTRSVTRAAERLGVAQANVSVALNKLRAHFGDQLFSRTSRGMEPTPYAEQLLPELARTAQTLARLAAPRARFDPATASREFRICMTDISEIVILPSLVNHLRREAPGVVIEAERVSGESARRLESGAVDLAVGFMPQLLQGFRQQVLFEQDFVCLASRTHSRVRASPGRQQFAAEGHIVVTSSGTGHAIVDKVLARRRLERRVVLKVPSFLGVARLVATTELLVIVPRRLGEAMARHERIVILDPPVPLPSFAVKQHWHERFDADPGTAWLRATLKQLASRWAPEDG